VSLLRPAGSALGVVVVCLLAGELALRLACAVWLPANVVLAHHRVRDERVGWRLNPAYPDIDRWGFRNAAVPERADVVVIGDSQTYGYGVAPEQAWPSRLQTQTGRSVYNVACSAWGTAHGLVLFDSLRALQPRVVVAAVYAGNDLYDTFHLVDDLGQLTNLSTQDSPDRAALRDLQRRDPLHEKARHVTRLGRPTWPLRDALREHSRVFHLLHRVGGGSAALSGREAADWEAQRRRAQRHPAFLHAFDGGPGRRTLFTVPTRLLPQDVTDPRIAAGLQWTLAGLRDLARRSADAGAGFVVLWIPTKELVYGPLVEQAGGRRPADFDRLVQAETHVQQNVRRAAVSLGVRYVDALPALRQALLEGRRPYPVTADGHPTAAGYAEIARAVAGALDSSAAAL
jgi:hypothetical protein